MTTCGCQFATLSSGPVWSPEDIAEPAPTRPNGLPDIYRPDILENIEATIKELDSELRELSLDIHSHPEIRFEERHAHDVLTAFMEKHGFEVTKNYHLETAWLATFTHGEGGRTIGINSEMDALPGVGHACGHNLIAVSGVGVAIAIKKVLQKFDIAGKVALLGTPAEEGGSGKVILLEKGAYKDMSACLMCHPAPGPIGSVSLSSCLALERLTVEYFGHTAHAALSPWEGQNALDAAVLGYNNISALRQQLLPTHRVHGIIEGKDWAPNIIPDFARMICYVRAPTRSELQVTLKRVLPCFEAAALATGCEVKIIKEGGTYDLRQNAALGGEVANIVTAKYGAIDYEWGIKSASTDFGNVTYALPSLHPGFAIPTSKDGGNHTPEFEKAAATLPAHYACLDVTKALAATGVRVLIDDEFLAKVKNAFENDAEIQSLLKDTKFD
ncbi:putative peptidase dimerisation domain containing protein [Lyophyllum shimeji]|uniref:Peptidase M20 domain-containing protein 2 n=1 Tax=Lyophyllum shimeji TaxID=47721 RepID=A0A9P3PQT5_LYOSH|nr:putative peptidase dimerisation domain containing protein [Lyophyllum shimeji]